MRRLIRGIIPVPGAFSRPIQRSRRVPMNGCFSDSYAEAREKFLGAAREAGAGTSSFALAVRGPDGGELATDAAWLGAAEAGRVLVTTSGVHGVEGFFG